MAEEIKNWKLKLRYGILKTDLKHFTVIADGIAGQLEHGFECRPGRAIMAMKVWAADVAEADDMIRSIGSDIGFEVDGRVRVYTTEPKQPPGDGPHGYDILFKPYQE